MEHNTIQGIIFDLDGTLLDSTGMWHEIDLEILAHYGKTAPENITEIVRTMSIEESSAYFVEEFSLPCTPGEIKTFVQDLARKAYEETLQLKPNVLPVLDYLDRRGIPYGVITATYTDLADAALKRLGLRDRIAFLLTEEEEGVTKSQPKLYQKAAGLLQLGKRQVAVVEDSLYCIQTAKQAGFFTIGVYDSVGELDWPEIRGTATVFYRDLQGMLEIFQ